ncbi:M1 family metallopeptidase [Novosphingobium flavum]|uniref:Aminopeptidase n=1 Tax=Novosphingobium aerophilum TaxID=2839843 RepID=A0A7X1KC97_9SPHN|nr:M1 family metallopeptidase [Novosphingobium aerophilum]MBC2651877.1 M1 family metallopeptidase [Novosphingobium aerophilum]MBC2661724.1 M1 family metallopeptidase [Novosphingobium aerophilum]
MRRLLFAVSSLSLALGGLAAPARAEATTSADVLALAPLPVGQLTDAARPGAYRLDLTVDPAQERFSGHVEIDVQLKRGARFIDLHGRDLAMRRAVARVGGRELVGTWHQLDETGVARLTFAEALPAGAVTLAFDYDAAFGTGPSGLFRVKVGDAWYAWTQFESIDARAAFPGFDEPGFKVPVTLTLRTPAGLKAVGNAPEQGVTQEGGFDVHRFAPTLPLPTYLVAMMVGPFVTVEGTVPANAHRATPLPLRVVSTRQNAGKLGFALEGSKGILAHLEDYFGQAFPYPKLDQITTPILPGAMENAGADLYNDSILVMDDGAPVAQKRNFGMVVAHELAHQWFGDLVTPAWWDDIWLNESFANWMGFRIGQAWRPDLNIGAGALEEGFAAMGTDALVAGRPIHQPITTNNQIEAAFDSITYGKGGHVVAMIAGYMGDDKFKAGVRRYMAAHRYGNATSTDFFRAMAEVAGDRRILPAMQSFTDQQGVPLVTFTGGPGRWTVRQSRYARLGTTPPPTRWGVPVCARQGETRRCQLLTAASAPFAISGTGPFMPNAGGTGYYRFELPAAQWDALIATADRLPGSEALALADSLRASYQAGRASPAQLIALARKLAANPDSYASGAALPPLIGLHASEFLDAAGTAGYQRLLRGLLAPRLAALGFDPRAGAHAGDDPEKSQARVQLVETLAGEAEDPALGQRLADAATAYLGGDRAALDHAFMGDALAAWLRREGLAGAQRLFAAALASEDPVFRPSALAAIGSSGKTDIANWVLADADDTRLRRSERIGLISRVVAGRETRRLGYAWLIAHFDAVMRSNGGIFFAARLPQTLAGACSVEEADTFARDLGPRFAGKPGQLELERAVERVRSCGRLKQARAAETSAVLAAIKD